MPCLNIVFAQVSKSSVVPHLVQGGRRSGLHISSYFTVAQSGRRSWRSKMAGHASNPPVQEEIRSLALLPTSLAWVIRALLSPQNVTMIPCGFVRIAAEG